MIQAYDRAVNLAKEKVSAKLKSKEQPQTGSEEVSNGEGLSTPSPNQQNWKVGDYVRSVYSEDGIVYEAIIKRIKETSSSCLVKYLGRLSEQHKNVCRI